MAWRVVPNKEEGKMIYADDILTLERFFLKQKRDIDARYILIPYTGMKDQNNKYLFENDFVDFTYTNSDGHDIETSGVIELDLKFTLGYIIREVATFALLNIVNTDLHNIRRIGNIHEKPELLKGVQPKK